MIPKEISAELDACLRSPGFRRDSKGGGGFYPKYLHSITLFVSLISGIGHFPDGHFGAIFSPNSGRGQLEAAFPRLGAHI